MSNTGNYHAFSRLRQASGKSQQLEHKLGVTLDDLYTEYFTKVGKCPQCAQPMSDMGLEFKAPKQRDVAAWKRIQSIHKLGHSFHSCGCHGPGFIPTSNLEYEKYLADRLAQYQSSYNNTLKRTDIDAEYRAERLEYWHSRIKLIQDYRDQLG